MLTMRLLWDDQHSRSILQHIAQDMMIDIILYVLATQAEVTNKQYIPVHVGMRLLDSLCFIYSVMNREGRQTSRSCQPTSLLFVFLFVMEILPHC